MGKNEWTKKQLYISGGTLSQYKYIPLWRKGERKIKVRFEWRRIGNFIEIVY